MNLGQFLKWVNLILCPAYSPALHDRISITSIAYGRLPAPIHNLRPQHQIPMAMVGGDIKSIPVTGLSLMIGNDSGNWWIPGRTSLEALLKFSRNDELAIMLFILYVDFWDNYLVATARITLVVGKPYIDNNRNEYATNAYNAFPHTTIRQSYEAIDSRRSISLRSERNSDSSH